tara:strand:+ start:10338 stop:10601 length:264 start_codon:yes stop_codon:yes gene_type:complete
MITMSDERYFPVQKKTFAAEGLKRHELLYSQLKPLEKEVETFISAYPGAPKWRYCHDTIHKTQGIAAETDKIISNEFASSAKGFRGV